MAVDKFPVEGSHIMMFARSVGDDNQIYYDEAYAKGTEPGGVIAPPTFAQSSAQFDPDYFLRPKPGEDWFGSGKEATGIKKKSSGGGGGGCASRLRSLETCSTIGFNLAACSDVVSGRCGVESRRTDLPVAGFWYTRMPSLSSSPTATYP